MSRIRALAPLAAGIALCLAGCGDPPTRVGQPCQTDEHCGREAGIELVCDHRVPGGSCYAPGCVLDDPGSCPPGALCTPDGEGTACRQRCQQVLDCREVIACQPDPDCDPTAGQCPEHCDNAITCVPADPALPLDDEDAERVCVFPGG